MNSVAIDRLISDLARELGLPDLGMDEQRMCVLNLGESLTVTLMCPCDSETLYLAAELSPLSPANRLAVYERLLKMNFMLMDTRGASLSIDEAGQSIFLCHALTPEQLGEDAALRAVGSFLSTSVALQADSRLRH